jgi:signal-transduction protein with cAMP-binding, CBS, and nucleotidyltransferase domain
MRAELMYKILLLWQTPYFKELSPYSLIMFASICNVKEYKYGEIVIAQGEVPKESYLIVHGCCESIY